MVMLVAEGVAYRPATPCISKGSMALPVPRHGVGDVCPQGVSPCETMNFCSLRTPPAMPSANHPPFTIRLRGGEDIDCTDAAAGGSKKKSFAILLRTLYSAMTRLLTGR